MRWQRHKLELSQEYLAELAGLHPNLERDMINPVLENVERLAKALEIAMARLFVEYGVEEEDD